MKTTEKLTRQEFELIQQLKHMNNHIVISIKNYGIALC